MDKLIKQQTIRESEIDRCIRNFRKANKDQKSSPGSLKKRLSALELEWENYLTAHKEILANYEETHKDLAYFKDDVISLVEDRIFETMGTISDMIDEITSKSGTGVQTEKIQAKASSDIQLPRINLPRFAGDYKSWPSFRDLFVSLIDKNNSLTLVQKLHYLKSSLIGEAETLIKHLQITDSNYKPAWILLNKRYENKRASLNAQLKTLLSLPHYSSESANSLRTMIDTTRECLEAIKGLGIDIVNWDSLIIHNLTQRLSVETLSQWELTLSKRIDPNEVPSLDEFLSFIETRFHTFEAINMARTRQSVKEKTSFAVQSKKSNESQGSSVSASKLGTCKLCKQNHLFKDCSKFLELNLNDRRALIQKFSYCYNCLAPGHQVTNCRSKFRCRACSGRHHTLLHQYTGLPEEIHQASYNKSMETPAQERSVNTSTRVDENKAQVLLATALILATNFEGYCIPMRALLDQGSESSFISQSAAKLLGLHGNATNVQIKGVGGAQIASSYKAVEFTLGSRYRPEFHLSVAALILPKLTSLIPPTRLNYQPCGHLKDLFLADPTYYKPGKVDVLLGADVYAHIIQEGVRKGPDGTLLAQRTSLGWILSGTVESRKSYTLERNSITSFHCQIELDELLRRFWEIEEGPVNVQLSEEEAKCEKLFQKTVQRQNDGRYIVKLPFNTENMRPELGESREMAIRQLWYIERKLTHSPELYEQYREFMKDYQQQGHMQIVSNENRSSKSNNYLPHHCVIKESSTTTKLRVVFDASRKTTNKKSLNDNLMVGPAVQEELFKILIRWRKHKIAFTADVRQMYRQILVDKDDIDYQRIFWRDTKDEPMLEYRLLTLTYGTSCAPYLATRTLNQLAQDEDETFTTASSTLRRDFYMDDVLSGGDSILEVLQLQADLKLLLRKGCFDLRKWVSNSEKILEGGGGKGSKSTT